MRLSRPVGRYDGKFKAGRPTRQQLCGYSASEFKTLLKLKGFKVPRNFWINSVATKNNRYYRFRWWSNNELLVDQSCPGPEFDRWANSTEQVLAFWFCKQ